MMTNNEFTVSFPIELFEEWVKNAGLEDGMILEHQSVSIRNVDLNTATGYLYIEGDLWKRTDS